MIQDDSEEGTVITWDSGIIRSQNETVLSLDIEGCFTEAELADVIAAIEKLLQRKRKRKKKRKKKR